MLPNRRMRAMANVHKHKDLFPSTTIWCAGDLPLAMRVERKLLFSLKRLFILLDTSNSTRADGRVSSKQMSTLLIGGIRRICMLEDGD